MERAPLRPVPSTALGPVDPEAAIRHVASALPQLDAPAASALAHVALAGRPRAEASLAETELGEALARGRKALRRASFPLAGSGWCERAERLISDRLDGALAEPGPARLDAHLRNCPRCVEHERRLVQATDALVAGFGSVAAAAPAAAPALQVVRRTQPIEVLPFGQPVRLSPLSPVASRRGEARSVASLAWAALIVFAVLLALAAIVLAIVGVAGAL